MSQQSRSWQRKYLAEHKNTENVFWYPEAQLPPQLRRNRLDDGYTPVGYPGAWIPVVPVGDNPEGSRRITEMLCHLLRMCVPRLMEVAPVITDLRCLVDTKAAYYVWTDTIMLDVVCACCGAIEQVPHIDAEESGKWLCAECVESNRWHEVYKEAA